MFKHYVVVLDWASDYEGAVDILGVAHTYEEAKEIFDKQLAEEKKLVEEYGYTIETEDSTTFDAGEEGYWSRNHTTLYIQGVN